VAGKIANVFGEGFVRGLRSSSFVDSPSSATEGGGPRESAETCEGEKCQETDSMTASRSVQCDLHDAV